MTVLVATDFSATADRALDEAIALGRRLGGRVEIVHIHPIDRLPVPPTLDLVTVSPTAEAVAAGEASLAEREGRVRAAGLEAGSFSSLGTPADEVVRRAAQIAADYLVVGRHGHSALTEILLGSVAGRIVRRSPCPVLVVSGTRA